MMIINNRRPLGIYIHIPFCLKKCNYCDFLSFAGSGGELQSVYLEALIKEIQYWSKVYNNNYYVDTLFVGGGTPSLLEPDCVLRLIQALREGFVLSEDAEISMEANPGTLTPEKLRCYLEAGVNRLSMGAQSLDDSVLHTLGRVHYGQEVLDGFRMAREIGFENINIDLMFGIPGQSEESWKATLEEILAMEPEHISFYSLQVEEGTPLYKQIEEKRLTLPDPEIDRQMYRRALDMLAAGGYVHYEISNAAKPGYASRHNLKYWSMEEYLGMGLGAHSYMAEMVDTTNETFPSEDRFVRFHNTENLEEYMGKDDPSGYRTPSVHHNTRQDDISEYLFTGLRRVGPAEHSAGISLAEFQHRYGVPLMDLYGAEIRRRQEEGLLILDEGEGTLVLTLDGIDVSNQVLADFV